MLLEAHSLSFRYGNTPALSDLTVSLPSGATGLLGPNGAGKTTLVRIIMGLLRIPKGKLRVHGREVATESKALKAVIGLVPEGEILVPDITAVQYTAYAGRISGLSSTEAMDRAHMVLHYVGLGGDRYRKIDGYSKGMRQRLKLAQALVHDPKLLILDEPTDGMDPKARDEMLDLLKELGDDHGKDLLLCTHLLDDVRRVCRRVLVLSQGRKMGLVDIEMQGKDTDLYAVTMRGPILPFIDFLKSHGFKVDVDADGEGQIALARGAADQFIEHAVSRSVQIRRLVPLRESLEEVFTRLVGKDT